MAAEYQANKFFFVPNPTKRTRDSYKFLSKWFLVHFVHDLESVYWQYLWFLHNRVPAELSPTSFESVQQQAALYFGHDIHGNEDRFAVIRDFWSHVEIKATLKSLHNSLPYLDPISFAENLREEYTRVVKSLPKQIGETWRLENVFNDEIYRDFHGMLQHLLRTETAAYPVVPIECADHTPTKKRKHQPPEPDALTNKKRKLQPPSKKQIHV